MAIIQACQSNGSGACLGHVNARSRGTTINRIGHSHLEQRKHVKGMQHSTLATTRHYREWAYRRGGRWGTGAQTATTSPRGARCREGKRAGNSLRPRIPPCRGGEYQQSHKRHTRRFTTQQINTTHVTRHRNGITTTRNISEPWVE